MINATEGDTWSPQTISCLENQQTISILLRAPYRTDLECLPSDQQLINVVEHSFVRGCTDPICRQLYLDIFSELSQISG
jgi:hypothetical protein